MIGQSLGPYKILEPLGAGGMGEVWLGEDTRLGRKVAIKVLPAEFAGDPERLARFEQEARAAAALNHPNIAVVHDVGSEVDESGDTTHFIVQEFLAGETLRQLLDTGAVPLKKALRLAVEIAEALIAAHAAGIVHRDLKPENVYVTDGGHAKVLDFGLAKLTEVAPAASSASMSPTMLGTVAGQVMGTAGYMAPEQVEGEEVDGRVDLFAFGCVLYEMATGRRAFAGRNVPETLHLLVNAEPDPVVSIAPAVPLQLGWVVEKALAKDRAERYQTAAELAIDVRRLEADVAADRRVVNTGSFPASTPAADVGAAAVDQGARPMASVPSAGARTLPWLVALVAVVIAAATLWSRNEAADDDAPLFLPLEQVDVGNWSARERLAISPDGTRIVFAGEVELELLDLRRSTVPEPIRGTEYGSLPVFSPDGERILYEVDNELRIVRPGGALPQTLVRGVATDVFSLSWEADGRVLYTPDWGAPLMAVSAAAGDPIELAVPDPTIDEQTYAWASLLPGGDDLLYSVWAERWKVAVRSLSTGDSRVLVEDGYGARYVPSGHLVFVQDDQLLAATFDPATLAVGDASVVLDDVVANLGGGWGAYDFSSNGTLVYLQGAADPGRELWRVDADGARTLLTDQRAHYGALDLSRDGRSIVLTVHDPRFGSNLAIFEIARNQLTPLTTGTNWVVDPAFSADGARILYASENADHIGFRIRSLDGVGTDVPVSPVGITTWQSDWRQDGLIAYSTTSTADDDASRDIWTLTPDGLHEPFLAGPDNTGQPVFSPGGELLAYVSDRSGVDEVYVRRFPGRSEDQPWQVSRGGASGPRWSADGETIWFYDGGTVYSARLEDAAAPRTSDPVAGFSEVATEWDVAGDGSYLVTLDRREPPKLRMILNWFADLEAKVPHE